MYEFIAKISTIRGIDLAKPLIIETGKFLLTEFHRHDPVSKFNTYLEQMSNNIIEMIEINRNNDQNAEVKINQIQLAIKNIEPRNNFNEKWI